MRILQPIPALAVALIIGLATGCGGGDTGQETTAQKMTESSKPTLAATTQKAEIGKTAPGFTLTDLDGRQHRLSDYRGKVVVLEWFNPDCPFVKKHHERTRSMAETYTSASEMGAVWLAINSGAPGKQGHGLERNKLAKEDYGIEYPILLDESGKVGKAYDAKTTPHMYIIDSNGTLVYRGAIDSTRDAQNLGETNYVRKALEELSGGDQVSAKETQSYGCSVKYAS
jgi:peroxiredoxin